MEQQGNPRLYGYLEETANNSKSSETSRVCIPLADINRSSLGRGNKSLPLQLAPFRVARFRFLRLASGGLSGEQCLMEMISLNQCVCRRTLRERKEVVMCVAFRGPLDDSHSWTLIYCRGAANAGKVFASKPVQR